MHIHIFARHIRTRTGTVDHIIHHAQKGKSIPISNYAQWAATFQYSEYYFRVAAHIVCCVSYVSFFCTRTCSNTTIFTMYTVTTSKSTYDLPLLNISLWYTIVESTCRSQSTGLHALPDRLYNYSYKDLSILIFGTARLVGEYHFVQQSTFNKLQCNALLVL